MYRFALERLVRAVTVFLIVTFLTAMLLDLTPGDPAVAIAGDSATPAQLAAIRQEYGLNQPIIVQYFHWLGGILSGNWSISYQTRQSVLTMITQRLPVSIELVILSILIALVIAVPLGMYAAYRQGSILDRVSATLATAAVSIPGFVLALVLVIVFALKLHWFPVSGWVPLTQDPGQNLSHAFLPALVLGVGQAAVLQPVLRADALQTLQQDFITLARAKGMAPIQILVRHGLRPSSISLVTLVGLSFAALLGGTVIVETVFSLPGLGNLIINSILQKDLIAVQGTVTFIAAVYIVINLIVDASYPLLDPRVAR
jgi:peptide/nickel transport system permease protein